MKIKDLFYDERPREKLIRKGVESLSTTELIAILLRTGSRENNAIELARNILNENSASLNKISLNSVEVLSNIKGIGMAKAVTILAALELGKRGFEEECALVKKSITNSDIAYQFLIGNMKNLEHEEFWVLFLNRANYLIKKEMISKGGMNATIIDNRIITRKALEYKANGIIISHNHPSNNPSPSNSDINQTDLLRKALSTFDISLIDHLIICHNCYFSFAENSILYINK